MIEERIRRKIEELIDRAELSLVHDTSDRLRDNNQHVGERRAWIEALNVVQLAVPVHGNAYRRHIENAGESPSGDVTRVRTIALALRGLLQDIDAGLIADLGIQIRRRDHCALRRACQQQSVSLFQSTTCAN